MAIVALLIAVFAINPQPAIAAADFRVRFAG
jgi:hypothetical protein